MALTFERVLPRPGPLWGAYPARRAQGPELVRSLRWREVLQPAARPARAVACEARSVAFAWQALGADARQAALPVLRRRLRHEGLTPQAAGEALGLVCAFAQDTLGLEPRDTQRLVAAALLQASVVEMATGEGKTLAIALAAAVGGLAGMPVHVLTANDYLASRDAEALAPLYKALGLRVTALPHDNRDPAARRAAYAHDVVYATAQDIGFDFLRDRLSGATEALLTPQTPPALLPGLCMALLDEADAILLDEAEVPLVLSHSIRQHDRRALLWQGLSLARRLLPGRDFTVDPVDRRVSLTAHGAALGASLAAGLGAAWARERWRREVLTVALTALHGLQREVHYVVRDGAIELVDAVTGRVAAGRMWSHGLQVAVALKEGLAAPQETETLARTSFQRLFQRYWRVGGTSGTLREARAELRDVLGAPLVIVPPHRPSQLVMQPPRRFADAVARREAVCARVRGLRASGRPTLVGTDSIAESRALSAALRAHGIEHQVLDALHDAEEASIVARAGAAGQVTVATRMAGRGTDIALDAAAQRAGGLHVIVCQDNPSRRLDRQLMGRAARNGEPGSSECWLLPRNSTESRPRAADSLPSWTTFVRSSAVAARFALAAHRWHQWSEERRRAAVRRALLAQDLDWERRLAFAGPPR